MRTIIFNGIDIGLAIFSMAVGLWITAEIRHGTPNPVAIGGVLGCLAFTWTCLHNAKNRTNTEGDRR